MNEGRLDGIDRFMNPAQSSAQRAAYLTHRLLAFLRRQSLHPIAILVNEICRSLPELFNRTLMENIALKVELSLTNSGLLQTPNG